MVVKIKEHSKNSNAKLLDINKAYLVTAIYYSYSEAGRNSLHYMIHANLEGQGGLPGSVDDDEINIIDGYIPPHWVVSHQVDRYNQRRTIITYPEWAAEPDYYEKLDDNESDNMAAINKYGEEMQKLIAHYKNTDIKNISI